MRDHNNRNFDCAMAHNGYLSDLVVLLYHFILEIVIRLTVFLGVVQLILKTLELLLDAFNELVMFSVLWVKVVELLLVLKALL